jgi:hypothetical protein
VCHPTTVRIIIVQGRPDRTRNSIACPPARVLLQSQSPSRILPARTPKIYCERSLSSETHSLLFAVAFSPSRTPARIPSHLFLHVKIAICCATTRTGATGPSPRLWRPNDGMQIMQRKQNLALAAGRVADRCRYPGLCAATVQR